ncbi:helix-turn-helix domain-containing protein [Dermatophilaceae bacterium Soc4.6]
MSSRKAWEVAYQRDRAAGRRRYVDAQPTRARLTELAAAHVPLRALARATGLSDTGVKKILDGSVEQVQRATAAQVATVSLPRLYEAQTRGHVPPVGAVRRVQALMAMGWSHDDLKAAGVPNTPQLLSSSGDLMTVQRWRQVRDVYDRLAMTPGPSPQTRARARRLDYPPPLSWDEGSIDDPGARPVGDAVEGAGAEVIDMVAVRRAIGSAGAGPPLNARERREVARALASTGDSDAQIGRQLGVSGRTVLRIRHREDIAAGGATDRVGSSEVEWAAASAATRDRVGREGAPGQPAGALARPFGCKPLTG